MKKVFIIHGLQGSPNGGWRPWLMAELEKMDVYACALAMPDPDKPVCDDWVGELARHIEPDGSDDIYLVGHSLGVPAILHYLEGSTPIAGSVLVSGPCKSLDVEEIEGFLGNKFDYEAIRKNCSQFAVIHGDNDHLVPLLHARELTRELGAELTWVKNGGHLNGGSGWNALPQCLEALEKMFK